MAWKLYDSNWTRKKVLCPESGSKNYYFETRLSHLYLQWRGGSKSQLICFWCVNKQVFVVFHKMNWCIAMYQKTCFVCIKYHSDRRNMQWKCLFCKMALSNLVGNVTKCLSCREISKKDVFVGHTRIREIRMWGVPDDDREKKIPHFLLFSAFLSSF